MDIDWKLLVRVREQHKLRAQQQVVRERAAAQAAQAQVAAARQAWQQQVDAQASLWSELVTTPAALDITGLRQASAWSRALDGRIAHAAAGVQQAQHAEQHQQQRLDQSRRALRSSAGELSKAEQMHERAQRERLGLQQRRADEALDEAATQTWRLRHGTP
ncbi:MAG: serine kinase [Rhizobacter sp.]|nr:serine kinase [Rhizobacter sp.]